MSLASDVFATIFEAKGHSAVVSAFNQVGIAQEALAIKEAKLAQLPIDQLAARKEAALSVARAEQSVASAARTTALSAAAGVTAWAYGMMRLTDEYIRFGNAVMNVRDTTGASAKDSVRAETLARVAGVNDPQEMRELLRIGTSVFNGKGQSALARLGISASPNQNGLELFDKIADRLEGMQDGLRKTQIMEDLFGQRGVAAMLPLLRLTKDQREEVKNLADTFNADGLGAIQAFQFQAGLTGQTVMQDFVYPLARSAMPIITEVFEFVRKLAHGFSVLNEAMGGSLGAAIVFFGVAKAISTAVTAVQALTTAYKGLAIAEAFAEGPAGLAKLAAGVAVAGLATVAINKAIDGVSGSPGSDGHAQAVDKFSNSVDKMEKVVNRLGDSFDSVKGGGIPGGLSQLDIGAIYRNGDLRTIG